MIRSIHTSGRRNSISTLQVCNSITSRTRSAICSRLSIYAKALEEGEGFEQKYMALLRDTAVMSVEDLAMKHLGEDITKQEFWAKGVALCVKDVEEFLELTSVKG